MNGEEVETAGVDSNTMVETENLTGEEAKTIAAAKKTVVARADQDQEQANFTGEVARQVQAVLDSPETAVLVAKRSYDTAKLAAGLALVTAFETKRATRQEALGGLRTAGGALTEGFSKAKIAVTDYRESVRLAYPGDKALQQSLGLSERVPQDQEKFLVYTHTCAATAKKAPHAKALDDTGFEITGYDSTLATFATARTNFLLAEQTAKSATVARDGAFKALNTWAQSFRRAARLALKARPELLNPLGL